MEVMKSIFERSRGAPALALCLVALTAALLSTSNMYAQHAYYEENGPRPLPIVTHNGSVIAPLPVVAPSVQGQVLIKDGKRLQLNQQNSFGSFYLGTNTPVNIRFQDKGLQTIYAPPAAVIQQEQVTDYAPVGNGGGQFQAPAQLQAPCANGVCQAPAQQQAFAPQYQQAPVQQQQSFAPQYQQSFAPQQQAFAQPSYVQQACAPQGLRHLRYSNRAFLQQQQVYSQPLLQQQQVYSQPALLQQQVYSQPAYLQSSFLVNRPLFFRGRHVFLPRPVLGRPHGFFPRAPGVRIFRPF